MAPVTISETESFSYEPPESALTAKTILIKPNLGYPVAAPVTVSMKVLGRVLKSLREKNPGAELLIVEGVCSSVSLEEIAARLGVYDLLDGGTRLIDADRLPLKEYENTSPSIVRFPSMFAPALLSEVDCRISCSALKRTYLKEQPLISASLKNLYGLFPRSLYKARSANSRGQLHRPSVPLILRDVYFTIGHLFDGSIVDAHQIYHSRDWKPDRGEAIFFGKVFAGEDIIAVDRLACRTAGEPLPDYLDAIDSLRLQN